MSSISLVFCVQIDYGSFSFNGWRLTLVDALDTMWIMDLRTEFAQALPIIANMTFHQEPVSSRFSICLHNVCSYAV